MLAVYLPSGDGIGAEKLQAVVTVYLRFRWWNRRWRLQAVINDVPARRVMEWVLKTAGSVSGVSVLKEAE